MNIDFLRFIGLGLLALIVSYYLFRNLPIWLDKLFERVSILNKVDKTLAHFLADSFGIAVVVIATVYFILLLPENASFVAVLLTVASGAFIFISEGWFGDALAGISLQLFPQYKVGDWVTLTENHRGKVKRLGLFRTELITIDLDVISVKNAEIIAKDIINHSGIPFRRVDIIAHTADYGEFGYDVQGYKEEILRIANNVQDKVCPDARDAGHSPSVFFTEFGSSSDHIHVIFFSYDRDNLYGPSLDAMHTTLAAELRPRGVVLGQVNANTIDNAVLFSHVRYFKNTNNRTWVEQTLRAIQTLLSSTDANEEK